MNRAPHRSLPRRLRLATAALLSLACLLAVARERPSTAHAATFTVTSTADAVDANPGDGQCATVAGECTLRAAIMEANAAALASTIVLPLGTYTLSLPGPLADRAADLRIVAPMTISGAGSAVTVIDGGRANGVLSIVGNVVVAISGVTMRGGNRTGAGGGIQNAGDLALTDVVVTGNAASTSGGGISSSGRLRLTDVTVTGNSAATAGGGIALLAGTSELRALRATVDSNQVAAGSGGGIWARGGVLSLADSTVSNNVAGGDTSDGGGLYVTGVTQAELSASAIFGNSAGRTGGGVYNEQTSLMLVNVTISGNSAGAFGGGFANTGVLPPTLTHVTITANSAFSGGGVYNALVSRLALVNTLIAGNGPGNDCLPVGSTFSNGHNLDGDGSCALPAPTDQSGVNPLLGPLADNGGRTRTHALLSGSPALNAAAADGCPATDQRGIDRPQGGACDIGAFEQAPADQPQP